MTDEVKFKTEINEDEDKLIEVFTYMNKDCGRFIVLKDEKDVLDQIYTELYEMDCKYQNELHIVIRKKEMPEKEFKDLPEFDGC